MKLFRGLGWGFQTNRSEGGPHGRGWEGGSKLKPNPQKREGVPTPTSPKTTLNAFSFDYRILQCSAAHTKGVQMKRFATNRNNNKNV